MNMVEQALALDYRCRSVTLTLPWPPSANRYWTILPRPPYVVTSAKAKKYHADVAAIVFSENLGRLHGRLGLDIIAYPPDRRKRDVGNLDKILADSLQHCGLYEDDCQIWDKRVRWGASVDPSGDGFVDVTVTELG